MELVRSLYALWIAKHSRFNALKSAILQRKDEMSHGRICLKNGELK